MRDVSLAEHYIGCREATTVQRRQLVWINDRLPTCQLVRQHTSYEYGPEFKDFTYGWVVTML